MAKHMVRLSTSILEDPEIPIIDLLDWCNIRENLPRCSMVLEYVTYITGSFLV